MIDSHCHLDRLNLAPNETLDQALDSARRVGVKGFLCIGIDLTTVDTLQQLKAAHPDVWLSLGEHPLNDDLSTDGGDTLRALVASDSFIAVGETGLDYHYSPESKTQQITAFRTHLHVAAEVKKPVIVHTRAAQEDTLTAIREEGRGQPGVLHCFTETWDMAKRALDLGYYISISGIATFKNAGQLREVIKKVPLDRLLIETDSPWLAPVPFRGQPNQPKFLPEVAACVAREKNTDVETIARVTSDNFFRLFSLASVS